MTTIIYDGTFEGWLTAVFEVYEYKFSPVHITTRERFQPTLSGKHHDSISDEKKAHRVWKGLYSRLSGKALNNIYSCFLSEEKGIEDTLLQYVQYVFGSKQNIENNYSNPAVLIISQIAKKVHREKHRMEAFIRFQLTKDGLYYAVCQPDFNVLPLIEKFFKERYADQRWMIYDAGRKYGIYYDLGKVETVKLTFDEAAGNGKNIESIHDENEALYQQLWQTFFSSVNIVARKNLKLHIQHMPRRYWKYLPEKQPALPGT